MTIPELAPRRTFGGIVAVWVVAAVAAVLIGIFAPAEWRAPWVTVALGGCLVLSFAVQLAYGRSQNFTQRMAASILGALLVMGVIGFGFGLATLVPA
ncbi:MULTISPECIES: hypothetical protein [unclassified Microbacterium]|uniref:hypothetical protein n=1 Tax=unclassified Microbacterium TaxID=2609290 RepID=UPI00214C0F8A|nr:MULTISPECIES: hypothetical protein [unclassified Microbacterium]MCR2799586.1 hypothetical protein [Microbacterium sp. zg.Y818]MCR2826911.1 hypothetical protein [Microbacterium sp. zg.Y909]WIM21579.1 hypothetical protein QNO21_10660 [Microbacterium sp. zg-Y818]